jgi:AcrR family transcriptional regulator
MEDSKKEIRDATEEALKKHGYAEISIQKIADEFEKSKSLLYHHYESKDEILLDFMDKTLEKFTKTCIDDEIAEPVEQLEQKAFLGFRQEPATAKALIELRSQGIRNPEYRKRFKKFSKTYRKHLKEIIKQGKKEELFKKEINPENSAKFIDAVNREVMFNTATEETNKTLKNELEDYINKKIKA